MIDSVLTEKGTKLPLISLKGKSYLMVAYRLQWLTEKEENYSIDTQIMSETEDRAVVRAKITLFNPDGKVKKEATATKVETKKDFNDYIEKAETAAIGRALAMLGFGTQHAVSDLDEGSRIVDSPLNSSSKAAGASIASSSEAPATQAKPSFKDRYKSKTASKPAAQMTVAASIVAPAAPAPQDDL